MWSRLRTLAAGDYVLYLLPSVVQAGVALFLVPITTYFLDPADFGVFAMVIAVAMPVRSLAASGTSWVIGGNYFHEEEHERRTMLFNVLALEWLLRSLLILLLFLAAEPVMRVAVTDYRPEYAHYLKLVLMASWTGSLWPTVSFLMTVQKQPRSYALFSLVQISTNVVTTVVCLTVLHLGVEALFLALLAANSVSLVFELMYVRRFVDFSLDSRWLREIVRTGLRATPGGLAEMVSNMADKIFIQRWSGMGALGLYSHSQQYQSIFKMLTSALSNTLTPDSLQIFSKGLDREPLERVLSSWYGLLAIMGMGVALFADDLISLLTHGKFTGSAPLVLIWYLVVFSTSHGIPYATFLMAQKHNRVLMYTQLVPTLFGVALVAAGAYLFGIYGAAWALLATSVVTQAARWWAAHGLGYRGIAERRFLEALAIYLTVWIFDDFFRWNLGTELGLFAVLVPAVLMRFRLLPELVQAVAPR